ncbi:MAG TPA: toprim domain-containing protein [archaeon]|nr:toprim domain-containing protein [Candidatus Dormibacteraeota bacterium]HYB85043.1 toprim domain-containing protein [archaeon]
MRAPAQVRFEELQKLIQRLNDEAENGSLIVVEGVRDKKSLQSMGLRGRIACIQSSRRSTLSFAEQLDGEKNVIILMDFDRQGVFLANRLSRLLNAQSIHANLLLWRELRSLTRSDIRSIEELPRLHERLQQEVQFHRSAVADGRRHS